MTSAGGYGFKSLPLCFTRVSHCFFGVCNVRSDLVRTPSCPTFESTLRGFGDAR